MHENNLNKSTECPASFENIKNREQIWTSRQARSSDERDILIFLTPCSFYKNGRRKELSLMQREA